MHDLVYANREVEDIIKAKYPQAKITDASDYIHTERFELEVDADEDEFYPFAIKEGFATCCFGFAVRLQSLNFPETKTIKPKENQEKIEHWIELAKEIKDEH